MDGTGSIDSLQAVQDFGEHPLFYICCIFATVVGAIAGATASSRVRMDIVGVLVCGTIASLGGGTVRDILLTGMLNQQGTPTTVYWITGHDVQFLYMAIIFAATLFTPKLAVLTPYAPSRGFFVPSSWSLPMRSDF